MSYPAEPLKSAADQDVGQNPFDVPVEVVLYGLRHLVQKSQSRPLLRLLEKDIIDIEQLRSLVADLGDPSLLSRVTEEIDLIVDDYRRGVAMV